jgi:glutaredoxin 3
MTGEEKIMQEVLIYTRPGCPYCARALALLASKNAPVKEISAGSDPLRAEMIARAGRSTYPQIFIGATHVGGCDDLVALDAKGGLDTLLAAA